uniref:Uncharacterized protein n=1 Tax=viral metagenome TaxID=1070528 RepID=A0A6C0JSR4_9ZZZZ
MRKKTYYEIRYWPTEFDYSKGIGRHLITNRKTANRIVKRFKKAGIKAFTIPVVVEN